MNKRKIKKQKKALINKRALKNIISHSNICRHAINELKIAGYNKNDNGPNGWMYRQILETVAVFASHNNSGTSAHYEIELVKKLCNFETISPLTLKDDEWNRISNDDTYQNKRNSTFFKEKDNSIHCLYAYSKRVVKSKYFGTNEIVDNVDNLCWHGGFWLTDKNIITGEYVCKCNLHKEDTLKPYVPKETIYLNCTEIEVAKDDWMMFVDKNSKEYIELTINYDVQIINIDSIKGININNITFEQANIAENELKTIK